ncbi:MAG: autotransporter domain-containing protein [Verrucomicrobiota bacterium]
MFKFKVTILAYLGCISLGVAANLVVSDSTTGITNSNISSSLSSGDIINFTGTVSSGISDAVVFNPVPSSLTITIESTASLLATGAGFHALKFSEDFDGTLTVLGTISASGTGGEAILFDKNFTGSLINYGIITSNDDGIYFEENLDGTLTNSGTITTADTGILVEENLTGTLINTGSINSVDGTSLSNGVNISGNLIGTFVNSGTIYTTSSLSGLRTRNVIGSLFNYGTIASDQGDGIFISENLSGILLNTGSIIGGFQGGDEGILIARDLIGSLTNSGTILGGDEGIQVSANLSGTITNSGIIKGNDEGIRIFGNGTGTITNNGGKIQSGNGVAILLGSNNGTVILSGPSRIIGTIDGESGAGDILRFENTRGVNASKQAELEALAAADADGTVTLFGETITWQNFEDIQFDSSSVQAYQDLLTSPELNQFAWALDNVLSLDDDDFREFLTVLNNVDLSILDDTLRNSSGLTILDGMTDFAQSQDTGLFGQIMNQLFTVRDGASGFNSNSFTLLNDLDNQSMQRLKNNLIALNTNGVSDVSTLDRASLEPLGEELRSNVYLTGFAEASYQDNTGNRAKSSSIRGTAILGGGSWLTENLYIGGFGGYAKNDSRVDIFDSSLTTHSAYVGVNVSYVRNRWFANVMAGFGYHDIYTTRWNAANQQFNGENSGYQGMVMSQIGYDWILNKTGTSRISPYMGMSYSTMHTDGYTETGSAPTVALRFSDGSIETLQTTAGFNYTCHYETFFGYIRPRVSAAWWHALEKSSSYAMSLATPGLLNNFTVESSNTNRNRAVYSAGVTIGLDELTDWAFHFAYQGSTGSEGYQSHGGTAGALVEF